MIAKIVYGHCLLTLDAKPGQGDEPAREPETIVYDDEGTEVGRHEDYGLANQQAKSRWHEAMAEQHIAAAHA